MVVQREVYANSSHIFQIRMYIPTVWVWTSYTPWAVVTKMESECREYQDTLTENVIDLNSLIDLFNPCLVVAYGSVVTGIKINKRKIRSDVDILIVVDRLEDISNFKRSYMLNKFCSLTNRYIDAIWLSRSKFAELFNCNSFKSFLRSWKIIYVGDEEWFKNLSRS